MMRHHPDLVIVPTRTMYHAATILAHGLDVHPKSIVHPANLRPALQGIRPSRVYVLGRVDDLDHAYIRTLGATVYQVDDVVTYIEEWQGDAEHRRTTSHAALLDDFGGTLDEEHTGNHYPLRWALVEHGYKDGTVWHTTHDTPTDAMRYHLDQEDAHAWQIHSLVDLDLDLRYAGAVTVNWRPA